MCGVYGSKRSILQQFELHFTLVNFSLKIKNALGLNLRIYLFEFHTSRSSFILQYRSRLDKEDMGVLVVFRNVTRPVLEIS